MATSSYEVLVDELTVHQDVRPLFNPVNGEPRGFQMGRGRIWIKGEKIPEDEVATFYKDALDDKDHPAHEELSRKLKKTSGEGQEDLAKRLGLPFEGYDDMDEDAIVSAMRVLPSATIQRIKRYEQAKDEPNPRVVNYNIGFGESPLDRQLTEVDQNEMDENKAVRNITTRNVPDDGPVQPGEGITGTGDPQIPYGSAKEKEEDTTKGAALGDLKGAGSKARRGRRDRQPKPTPGLSKGEGGGSLQTQND
jgi:hypothetical protein